MGRHSSPNQWPFYRSVAGYFFPWVLVAAVIVAATWIAISSVGGEDFDQRRPNAGATGPTESPSPEESEPEATPTSTPEPTETAAPTEDPTVELITEGVTVQVLNATDDDAAGDAMAERLADLGYQVIAINAAVGEYPTTTVLWSADEWQDAAEALATRFGWLSEPKPENLSDQVAIHVVVGDDEAA